MWLDYHDALSYQCNTVCATVIQTFLPQVQTGFGRLGSSYWGFEDAGVTPDIGKKLSGGYCVKYSFKKIYIL